MSDRRSVTYVEMDLDVYRVTRFEDAQAGQSVRNWKSMLGTNNIDTMEGASEPTFPSGKALRIVTGTAAAGAFAVWEWLSPAPGPFGSTIRDCSIVALMRSASSTITMGISLRGGATLPFTGYIFDVNGTQARILKSVAGAGPSLATINFPVGQNDNVWLRFDAVNISGGVQLRAKIWRGAISDEPALFMLAAFDNSSPLLTAGLTGLRGRASLATDIRVGYYRVRSLFGNFIETHRHVMPANYVPTRKLQATPDVVSVSLNPAAISLGSDLGKRAQLTVTFSDHPGGDLGELFGSGSEWGKFRARGLFRRGQPMRIIRGTLDQNFPAMERRHYVLESFSGPSRDGKFVIIAQDLFKLADNDRAQAPRLSNGSLLSAITASDTTATLTPAGVGDAEYPSSGFVAIGGSEICIFSRAGDTLTLTRGQSGTVGVAHDAQDRVQLCVSFTALTAAFIANVLLTQYAGIPAGNIPLADWEAECAQHLQRLYTRLIAEPTGVNQLVSELCEQAGLAMWWDDLTNQLRLQVLRGIPTTAYTYDESTTLAGSIQSQEQPSTQITQIWTYYGVRNPLEPLDDASNYRSTLATIDTEGESLNGQAVIRKIYGTWIPAFGQTTAQRLNDIQIGRFAVPPRRITFAVQRGSGVPEPVPGGGYRITWQGNQDEAGQQITAPIQVIRVNPLADRIEAEAEEMLFRQFDPDDLTDRVITIDSPINNIHLPTLHASIFPPITPDDVTNGVTLTVIINSNVIVGSASTAVPAFDVGTSSDWPAGLPITIQLQANGRIQGAGGMGAYFSSGPQAAGAGGPALKTRFAITLTNGGLLWGGGGGGGLGRDPLPPQEAGGGGGAGTVPGAGGPGNGTSVNVGGMAGNANGGGAGGVSVTTSGGAGGGPGQSGASGTGLLAAPGASAGAAIDGIAFVSGASGDIRGPQI